MTVNGKAKCQEKIIEVNYDLTKDTCLSNCQVYLLNGHKMYGNTAKSLAVFFYNFRITTFGGNLFITDLLEEIDIFDQDKISMANVNGVFTITVEQFNPVEQKVTKCASVFASVTTLIKFEFGRTN